MKLRTWTAHEIEYKGQTFRSLMAFCKEYGLTYPAAYADFKKGVTPEELIRKGTVSTPIRKTARKKRVASGEGIEYMGKRYANVMDAADQLGISPETVYAKLREMTEGADARVAISHAAEAADIDHENYANHTVPCVINGIQYESRAHAARVNGVAMSTVRSRMERLNISFEEALRMSTRQRKRLLPVPELSDQVKRLAPAEDAPLLADIKERLTEAEIRCEYVRSDGIQGLRAGIDIAAESAIRGTTIPMELRAATLYILTAERQGWTELLIPDLYHSGSDLGPAINELNRKYFGVKFWQEKGTVKASVYFWTKADLGSLRKVIEAVFTLIGTSQEALRVLLSYSK